MNPCATQKRRKSMSIRTRILTDPRLIADIEANGSRGKRLLRPLRPN